MSDEVSQFTFDTLVASIEEYQDRYQADVTPQEYFGFPIAAILDSENSLINPSVSSTGYFSMEYGIAPSIYNSFRLNQPLRQANQFFTHEVFSNYWLCDYLFRIYIDKMLDIPIYGGGLGVLAGDTIKSAADLNYSMVAIGILWNKGYFKQNFWYKRGQVPEELKWDPHSYPGLIPLKNRIVIDTCQGPLTLRLWKYHVYSYDRQHACPVILLDSNDPTNPPHFQQLTDQLYRSDSVWWKIFQRVILGIGGMKALDSLGYHINTYHLNEGHAAFALLEKYVALNDKDQMGNEKNKFVFTCHTPVAAGHDRFSIADLAEILPPEYIDAAHRYGKEGPQADQINLTFMSLNNCPRVNAVAVKHGEVMRLQFPAFAAKIGSITNGVHLHTWISEPIQDLLDRYSQIFSGWRQDPRLIGRIHELKGDPGFRQELFQAHLENKRHLIHLVEKWRLRNDVLTIGWARRITGYKRPALIFQNVERIIQIARQSGPIQIILAGKAHPNDDIGAAHIDHILEHIDRLNACRDIVKVLILENYDTFFGKLLTNSVDIWLNNPLPPFEASGTSGMKAILNGVLQLSTLDGWIVEAAEKDIGWIFGYQHRGPDIGKENQSRMDEDSRALYDALSGIVDLYYATYRNDRINIQSVWIDKMINCIAQAAFFNTQRMIQEYRQQMWERH